MMHLLSRPTNKLTPFALGETEKSVPLSTATLKQKKRNDRRDEGQEASLRHTLTHEQHLGFTWASPSLQSPCEKKFSILTLRARPLI